MLPDFFVLPFFQHLEAQGLCRCYALEPVLLHLVQAGGRVQFLCFQVNQFVALVFSNKQFLKKIGLKKPIVDRSIFWGRLFWDPSKKPEKPETDPDIANEIGEFLMILRRFAFNFVSLMNTGASSSALGNGDFLRPRNVGCGKSGGGPRVSPLFWEGKYGMDSDKGHLGLEGFLLQVSD